MLGASVGESASKISATNFPLFLDEQRSRNLLSWKDGAEILGSGVQYPQLTTFCTPRCCSLSSTSCLDL
jgi:hypothetical protein